MGKLDGKVAIITGCSGGLGKQMALRFAAEGAKLAICARSADKLAATAQACRDLGAEVVDMPTDLCQLDQMKAFVQATVDRFGTVDILVNNAVSIPNPHSFLDHTEEELASTFRSGLVATWHMMKLCFPYLKGKSASILNFGSGGGDLGMAGFAAYAVTKEAIRGLSRVVAREWGAYGIRVNTLSPAAMTENATAGIEHLDPETKAQILAGMTQVPLCRAGDPYEDITPVAVFLASDESRWITGQNLYVDGGGTIHS